MPEPVVHGYILAGGQSSRMGTDKALLPFGASTLLDRAIASLECFCTDVTVVGRSSSPSGGRSSSSTTGCRAIPDHRPGAGPVAGAEAALSDLAARNGTWAFFLPVDVPLLPAGLLHALTTHWLQNPLTRVAFPVVEGLAQPVITLLHVSALPALQQALALDQRRLRAALEQAAQQLAEDMSASRDDVLHTPNLLVKDGAIWADDHELPWSPSPQQLQLASLWFANANTPAELDRLRQASAAATDPAP